MPDLHPQLRPLLLADSAGPRLADVDALDTLRMGYARTAIELGGPAATVASVDEVVIARADGSSLRARVYGPSVAADPLGALVWNHGGGWVIGDLDGFDRVARGLANASGHVVVSVDYRLAPEHPYPAAVDDGELALRWAAGEGAVRFGFSADRIAVGGDSAGGQVAVDAARRARELLRAQLLVYPALDPAAGSQAYATFADGPMLSADDMRSCWACYLSGDARPLALESASLAGMPPAWVAIAGHDPLRDDGLAYAELLRRAGVPATVEVYEDMVHGFLRFGGVLDRALELIGWLGDGARIALAG